MERDKITKLLWDELRLIACSTGLKAQRIVLVHESDIKKLVDKITLSVEIKKK